MCDLHAVHSMLGEEPQAANLGMLQRFPVDLEASREATLRLRMIYDLARPPDTAMAQGLLVMRACLMRLAGVGRQPHVCPGHGYLLIFCCMAVLCLLCVHPACI
jgi:hypothetical protein